MPSWSLVEVPRYLFYIVKLLNVSMPSWLLFLRYNLFLVLYPTGITGEILTIYRSLPFIKSTHLFSFALPNAWNFAFNYYAVSVFYLLLYIPRSVWCIGDKNSRSFHDHEHVEPEKEERDVLNAWVKYSGLTPRRRRVSNASHSVAKEVVCCLF